MTVCPVVVWLLLLLLLLLLSLLLLLLTLVVVIGVSITMLLAVGVLWRLRVSRIITAITVRIVDGHGCPWLGPVLVLEWLLGSIRCGTFPSKLSQVSDG